jgi:hypothetical protein
MENVVILYYHLEYFSVIWYNLWPFGMVCGHFFPVLACLDKEKSGNPGIRTLTSESLKGVNLRLAHFSGLGSDRRRPEASSVVTSGVGVVGSMPCTTSPAKRLPKTGTKLKVFLKVLH